MGDREWHHDAYSCAASPPLLDHCSSASRPRSLLLCFPSTAPLPPAGSPGPPHARLSALVCAAAAAATASTFPGKRSSWACNRGVSQSRPVHQRAVPPPRPVWERRLFGLPRYVSVPRPRFARLTYPPSTRQDLPQKLSQKPKQVFFFCLKI